jgi:ribonucleotide reductase alpha subunit
VKTERGSFGSEIDPSKVSFDHAELHRVTKIVTRNLNKIIDINSYPVEEARRSNLRHRPIGLGVSGLADCFLRMGLPFCSTQAKQLNQAIFETIYHAALEASAELAEREGFYESFPGSPTSRGQLQSDLWGVPDDQSPSHRYFEETHHAERTDDSFTATLEPASQQLYPDECLASKGYDWNALRHRIVKTGLRNSLLLAPMPTASTSQILGVNECFEPFSSNLYIRRVKAGEFIMINPHLLQDLTDRGLWSPAVRNQLMQDGGSIANIDAIPPRLKELYKTAWEMKMKDIIDMAADRGIYIDQSQSLNLFIANPTIDKLTAMHFYAWKKGLKVRFNEFGMHISRRRSAY